MNTKLNVLLRSSLLAAGVLSLGGCHVFFSGPRHHRPVVVHHREPAHVTVVHRSEPDHTHYCNDGCDHMWNGSTFVVVVGGHRHRHNCGHELVGRRWVVARVVVSGDGGHDGGHDGGGRGDGGHDGGGRGNGNGNGNGGGRGNGKPR